jgi:hypothetical protein
VQCSLASTTVKYVHGESSPGNLRDNPGSEAGAVSVAELKSKAKAQRVFVTLLPDLAANCAFALEGGPTYAYVLYASWLASPFRSCPGVHDGRGNQPRGLSQLSATILIALCPSQGKPV